MMSARMLHRRLEKLEAVLNVLLTDDKWAVVHERALQLMSDQDLEILEELALLENAGSAVDQSPERSAAMARFDDACWTRCASTSRIRRAPITHYPRDLAFLFRGCRSIHSRNLAVFEVLC